MDFSDIDRRFFYDGDLGVKLGENETSFSVWAPLAEAVELRLYSSQTNPASEILPMAADSSGVWRYVYPLRLEGFFYTYDFTYGGIRRECVDIYACAAGTNGKKGYIADLKKLNPKGWEKTGYVRLDSPADAIIYEMSVRDFSSDPSSHISDEARGKFAALKDSSSALSTGEPTCLGHLKRLGVTHVQIMPFFDFEGVDELNPLLSYNWGYNPSNYNLPEGSLSIRPDDPEERIRELKNMILSLHSAGIGVIMDVVYNHTYRTEDSSFGITFPGYFYRKDASGRYSNGSGCGNEIASERAMVRKYITDSVLFWAREYKIDGFRFDLMGVLDTDTVNGIAEKLKKINPSAILYGEGWTGGETALSHDKAATKHNARATPAFAYFNDGYRDAVKGDTFADAALGYISGNYHYRQTVVNGLLGSAPWAGSPCQTINYCEAHDNLTLWDKLCVSVGNVSEEDRKKMSRLAMALIMLAQGIPFIQSGQEFLRSKPTASGFDHNSYRSPDSVNSIKWNLLHENAREAEYCRGLIAFRKAHKLLRIRNYYDIEHSSEVLSSQDGTIAIRLNGGENILILINPIPRAKMFMLPDGEWYLHVSDISASEKPLATYCEGVVVPPISAMVLVRK